MTLGEYVLLLIGIVGVMGLQPVFRSLYVESAGSMDTLTATVFSIMTPVAILVILGVIYIDAIGGLR